MQQTTRAVATKFSFVPEDVEKYFCHTAPTDGELYYSQPINPQVAFLCLRAQLEKELSGFSWLWFCPVARLNGATHALD